MPGTVHSICYAVKNSERYHFLPVVTIIHKANEACTASEHGLIPSTVVAVAHTPV